jgi:hypothetical protein
LVTGGEGVSEPGVVTVSAQISDDVIGGWSPWCHEVLEKLHDHLECFTRFIPLHRGHLPPEIPVQRTAPRERNSPATLGTNREAEFLVIVPTSGTGALTGITGTGGLAVDEDGTHRIWFNYEIP